MTPGARPLSPFRPSPLVLLLVSFIFHLSASLCVFLSVVCVFTPLSLSLPPPPPLSLSLSLSLSPSLCVYVCVCRRGEDKGAGVYVCYD